MLYARQNYEGVSVNESTICTNCLYESEVLDASYELWQNAEDVTEFTDDTLYPADNPDGVCNGCGAHYKEDQK